jgi:hypothetical protein
VGAGTTRMRNAALAALAVAVLAPSAAGAAPVTIGAGHKPGVAVDAAGTAYIAWYGPESNTTSLQFCRLPRGASACDIRTTLAAPGTTLSRPFVTVDGATVRVVSYRYGLTGARFDQIWELTSGDGGASFDAGHPAGIAPFDEAALGPGGTLMVTTNAESTGLAVQQVPLAGSDAGDSQAILSADHPYNGTVGLIDANTPLAVFDDGSSNAQFSRYSGSGNLNDAASWTPPADIGYADYPRLAGGPTGLFLLYGTPTNTIAVRKYTGVTFSAATQVAPFGDDAQAHLTEDPGGRLHAVYGHNTADGLELDYATSDNGTTWQSGPIFTETDPTQALNALRAAVAPDHIGVVAWETGSSSQVRVAAIGPTGGISPPFPGKSVAVGLVSGKVFVTVPGGKRTQLTAGATIPVGAKVDTTRGRVRLTSAATANGRTTQTADFYQGSFVVKQRTAKGNAALTTDLVLRDAIARSQCAPLRGAAVAVADKKKKGPKSVLGKLWGNGKGKFRTSGKYSSATVRGTIWLTQDRCDGTLTTVKRGTVSVRDLRRHKTVTVKAGRSYLARARR